MIDRLGVGLAIDVPLRWRDETISSLIGFARNVDGKRRSEVANLLDAAEEEERRRSRPRGAAADDAFWTMLANVIEEPEPRRIYEMGWAEKK